MPRSPDTPTWVDSAIVYGVIPPLFGSPPLRAVRERLPYLRDLGVNALWMSPICPRPLGDYGYAVVDYLNVNPEYGTDDDLRGLVTTAHDLGIRVLMDLVPNHSSDQHPFFLDAQANGPRSTYYDWYDRDAEGNPTHYFDWTNLPNFNFENPRVREYVTEALSFWLRKFDIDGYRMDACWGVQYRRPGFWAECTATLRRVKPDILLLAEASARDPYWYANGWDAAYDWTDDLGHWAWQEVFDEPDQIAGRLARALDADPEPDRVFRFLNNNDTGERFHTVHGVPLTRVAAALVLTLPGLPCIYTGEEIGAAYRPYPIPSALDWSRDPAGLKPWYTALCRLRTEHASLHSRHSTWVEVSPQHGELVAYRRHGPDGEQPLLVVLNFGSDDVVAAVGGDEPLTDLLNAGGGPFSSAAVPMPSFSARVLAA